MLLIYCEQLHVWIYNLHKMQRTPPGDHAIRDLSNSIIVSQAESKQLPAPQQNLSENREISGVHTGTRSKTTQRIPKDIDPTRGRAAESNPNIIANPDPLMMRSTSDRPKDLSAPVVTDCRIINPSPSFVPTKSSAGSSSAAEDKIKNNLPVSNLEIAQADDLLGATGPVSPSYISLVDNLIGTVQESSRVQISKEIEQKVNESVKNCLEDLLRNYEIVPRAVLKPSSSAGVNLGDISAADFIKEFSARLAVRSNNNNEVRSGLADIPLNGRSNQPSRVGNADRYFAESGRTSEEAPQNERAMTSQYFDRKPIRLDHWDVKFDGKREGAITVEEFVFRVEYLQMHYNCPVEILMRDFHLLLRDNAKEWYWIYIRNNRNADWGNLRHALLFQFQSTTSDFEVMRDIVERRQQMNESVDAYFHAMLKLRSKLVKPVPEFDMVSIIKRNLRDSIPRMVYPMSIYSVDQLRHECYKIEINFGKVFRGPSPNINRFQPATRGAHVNEVVAEEDESSVEEVIGYNVEEVRITNQGQGVNDKSKLICWNCREAGHVFMVCPQDPKIFCYRCGLA